jgi:cardiolipin synthase
MSVIMAIVLITQILRERRPPSSTLAWLIMMIFVPYLGVPLYLLLGVRKVGKLTQPKTALFSPVPHESLPSDALPVERMLLASGVPPKSRGNEVILLKTGEEAYASIIDLLENAKHRINISTFILGRDEVGRQILETLTQRALQGVEVRLLLDGLGSFWVFRSKLKSYRAAGGQVAYFLPLIHFPFAGHSNLRNHRKILIVDGAKAIMGGMNLATEYMGAQLDPKRWVDLSLRVIGPTVKDLELIFWADWHFASREKCHADGLKNYEEKTLVGGESAFETAQLVATGPDIVGDPLYDSIATAVFAAKKRIWIATPYFIPDETLSKSLELAAKRGVDVRVFVPEKSNHKLADLCRGSYVRQVQKAGAQVFLYENKMMHAKVLIVDDLYTTVGSANFDMRSLFLNYEIGLLFYSVSAIREIGQWFEDLIPHSKLLEVRTQESWSSQIIEGVARVFSPVL